MVIRRVAGLVLALVFVVAGLGAQPARAETASPSPSQPASSTASPAPSSAGEPTGPPAQAPPAGPPGWLLILIGVAILIFTFTGGATRLAKRFQQPPPP